LSFVLACYSTVQSTKEMVKDREAREKAVRLLKNVGVEKIYLESYRRILLPSEQLKEIKQFFDREGFITAGGVCIGAWGEGFGERNIDFSVSRTPGYFVCLTSQASKEGLRKIMETTAEAFDNILIDDLYANFCHCDRCLGIFRERYGFDGDAKDFALAIARNDPNVTRNWEGFSLDLVKEASEEYVIAPARKVNPKVSISLKVAEWYEKFNHRGLSLKEMTSIFDGLYVGTESRENTARYGSYFLPQYARRIAAEKYEGSWFDTLSGYNYAVPISEQIYIEQARMSVLGQSPEITLFCLANLLEPRKAEHVSRLRAQLPTLRRISATTLTAKPIGVSVLKPYHSPHVTSHPETYIFDIIGTIGIPLKPVAELSREDKVVLITAHGAHRLDTNLLRDRENVFLTSGAVFELAKDRNHRILELAGLDTETPVLRDTVQANAVTFQATPFPRLLNHRRPSAIPLGPALKTTSASTILTAHDESGDYSVVTKNSCDGIDVYCLGLTWFPWYLKFGYPESIRQLFRDIVGEAMGFKISAQGEGLGDITCHTYDNGVLAIDNLYNTYLMIEVAINLEKTACTDDLTVKDAMSGVQLESKVEDGWAKVTLRMDPAELAVLRIEKRQDRRSR